MTLHVLTASDVDRALSDFSTEDLLLLVTQVYVRLSSGSGYNAPQRISTSSDHHLTLYMPGEIHEFGTAVKVVSVPHKQNSCHGLPASTLVIDEITGGVKAIVNARNLTAIRTAAASLLATRILGPTEPRTLVAFGAGKQIEAHIDLHLSAFPTITHCSVVNRSWNDRLRGLIARLRSRHQERRIDLVGITRSGQLLDDDQDLDTDPDTVKQLVLGANIICTATSSTTPLLPSSWVTPGTHINLVGSFTPTMHEVDTELIKRAGRVVVDSREACALEAGELIKAGLSKSDMVEMGEVVRVDLDKHVLPIQERIDSVKCGDITIFKQVGISLLDVAITSAVLVRAQSLALGTSFGDYDSP